MVTDNIADLIIQIKNAGMVRKEKIEIPYSKKRNSIAQKLRITNYIENAEARGHGTDKQIVITLAYDKEGNHRVSDVKRISKPGRRIYMGVHDIRPVKNNHGTLFISTPKGILTGDEARKGHVGGEALFSIW
jgi:small subunit ribosomal protein S8